MTAYESAISQIRSNQAALAARVLNADPLRNRSRLVYNAGIARESYFRSAGDTPASRAGLWKILQTDTQGNSPQYVSEASKLWSSSVAYKGMITTSYHREATPSTDDKVAAKSGNLILPTVNADGVNYGFQFHYNPGSVSMEYAGPPPVDVTLQTSGREKFNTYGPTSGSGTIGIQVVLNRINDMKYFDLRTGRLKAGVPRNVFTGRLPDNQELTDIYNRGTMYDMEFLFRTLLGYQFESSLGRGMNWDKKTADLGWLGGKPVEIHLGKSLRYLGRVIHVKIDHVLFTERMVPMFSEVGITFQRIPDVIPSTRPATPAVTPRVLSQTAQNIIAGVGSY
jgi:hypothetical protein